MSCEIKKKLKIVKVWVRNETQVMGDRLNYVQRAPIAQHVAQNYNMCDNTF